MTDLFQAISDRLKAVFATQAALELEAELLLRHAERKAGLLRRAAELEREGFADLASELRRHASAMDPQRPVECEVPRLPAPAGANAEPGERKKRQAN